MPVVSLVASTVVPEVLTSTPVVVPDVVVSAVVVPDVVVPLVVVLLLGRDLATPVRVLGLFYGVWTLYAPFQQLPGGDGVEPTYSFGHQFVDNFGIGLGLALLVLCGVLATRRTAEGTALAPRLLG